MFRFEKKIVDFIQAHMYFFVFAAVTFLGISVRISLRYMKSYDATVDLLPWYETIKENGGLHALGTQVGTYNVLYQFLIALMTYLPVPALYAYKGLSIIFDYLLALVVGRIIYEESESFGKWEALFGYAAVVLSPIVFINSAGWAQCDSIFVFFVVLALYKVKREDYLWAFVWLGAAFSFKLQAVLILPFFCWLYFSKKKFTALNFLIIPVVMCITSIPVFLAGRSITDTFSVYFSQTGEYPVMAEGYPSFWMLIARGDPLYGYTSMAGAAIILTVAVLLAWMVYWQVKNISPDGKNFIYMAFILSYSAVLFLPAMHERYGYIYEILAIIILIYDRRTIFAFAGMYILTLIEYGRFLFRSEDDLSVILAAANVIIYVVYSVILLKNSESDRNNW